MKRFEKNIVTIVASFLILCAFISCEKEETEILTDGVWKFEKLVTDSSDPALIHIVENEEVLREGGRMILREDGSYSLNWADPKPDENGIWVLNYHSELVLTDETGLSVTYFIKRLEKSELVVFEGIKDGTEFYSQFTTWVR